MDELAIGTIAIVIGLAGLVLGLLENSLAIVPLVLVLFGAVPFALRLGERLRQPRRSVSG